MEGAGKLVEDEDLREAMGAKGLGTPATRAAIIEGLLLEEYLRREGREITSTPKASALMELLQAVDIPGLTSPEMTGEWEYKLKQMERGELPRDRFMAEIVDLTQKIVERAKNFEESGFAAKPLGFNSPDGQPMVETLRHYQTADGKLQLRKVVAGRLLEPFEAKDLLLKRLIGPLQGFRSRLGRPFAAALKLNDANETEFVFDNAPIGADGVKLDLDTQEGDHRLPRLPGPHLRDADVLRLREQLRRRPHLQDEGRQKDFAAGHRSHAAAQAADREENRFAARLRLTTHAAQVLRLSGDGGGWENLLRVRAAQGRRGPEEAVFPQDGPGKRSC